MNKPLLALAVVLQWAFGYCIQQQRPLALAFQAASLLLIAMLLLRVPAREWPTLLGLRWPGGRAGWLGIGLGALLGLGFAMYYRHTAGQPLALGTLLPFAAMAAAIGFTEELLYRGLVYGALAHTPWRANTLSALAHAGYKFLIFFPILGAQYWVVGLLTFLVGLLLGYLRTRWQSLWPALGFHILFDVWVYGDQTAPWWVQ